MGKWGVGCKLLFARRSKRTQIAEDHSIEILGGPFTFSEEPFQKDRRTFVGSTAAFCGAVEYTVVEPRVKDDETISEMMAEGTLSKVNTDGLSLAALRYFVEEEANEDELD